MSTPPNQDHPAPPPLVAPKGTADALNIVDTLSTAAQPRARACTQDPGDGSDAENDSQLQQPPARAVSVTEAAGVLMVAFVSDPRIIPKTVEAVYNALDAHQMFFDKKKQEWVREPDARTQLTAAQFVFNNLVGLPLQRIEAKTMNVQTQGPDAMRVMLKKSPAMRAAVRRILEESEADK